MDTNLIVAYILGLATPLILALTAKAIKRVPSDLKSLFRGFGNSIRS